MEGIPPVSPLSKVRLDCPDVSAAEAQVERPLLLFCFPGRSVVGSADRVESRGLQTSKCEDPG